MAAGLPSIKSAGRQAIGAILGRLDRALVNFSDPADSFSFAWDLTQCRALRPLIDGVARQADRDAATRALDNFENRVEPVLLRLERQVIHNDLTPFNLLVSDNDDTVGGIIDFGDMIRAPRVNDLAVACAYHVANDGDPIAPLLEIVASYAMVNPLTPEECGVFLDVVRARLAITVLITERNAARNPENRAYLLKNHPTAVRGLSRLSSVDGGDFGTRLRRAAGLET
jgi:Ser/Thr protein kinase RdoA (MazF antagonist)